MGAVTVQAFAIAADGMTSQWLPAGEWFFPGPSLVWVVCLSYLGIYGVNATTLHLPLLALIVPAYLPGGLLLRQPE
jgi:hypothetical protein